MHISKESQRFVSARAVALQNLPQTFRGRERLKPGYAADLLPIYQYAVREGESTEVQSAIGRPHSAYMYPFSGRRGTGRPVLWPRMRHGFGRARGRRSARRCLRLEMCMETACSRACIFDFARHVPKSTRRGCGSAKLYPPEKALHERHDSNCSHGESARSTSGRG